MFCTTTDFNLVFLPWLILKAFSLNVTPRKTTFPISFPHWVAPPYLLERLIGSFSLTLCSGMHGSLLFSPFMTSVNIYCSKNQLIQFDEWKYFLYISFHWNWKIYRFLSFLLGLIKKKPLSAFGIVQRGLCYFAFLE